MKFKDLVVESAKEQIRKRKEEQEKDFQELYDKKRIYTFPPENSINMIKHFYFPKFIGPNRFGQKMTTAALAVYPVLCSWANFETNDWFQCSQENIAKMAGVSVNTVAKGIDDLVKNNFHLIEEGVEIPLLERERKIEGKRRFFKYRVGFIRKHKIDVWERGSLLFIFHTCIIHSGVWADLSPRAKALYLAMRSMAKFDREIYYSIEYPDIVLTPEEEEPGGTDTDMGDNDDRQIRQQYRDRKWDLCDLSLSELARMVGISTVNIQKPMQELEHHKLAERMGQSIKVYLRPKIRVENDSTII